MKKILATALVLVITLCLFSCGGNYFNKAVSQLKDYGLEPMAYDYKQIRSIEANLENANIHIEGKITKITHLVKQNISGLDYAYVYEFENRDDASLFYEGHAKNFISRLKVNVVVFGNVEMINTIKF